MTVRSAQDPRFTDPRFTMKLKAKKGVMTQLWKDDKVTPITSVILDEGNTVPDDLEEGAKITIVGTSKGKGFQGVVKRHGFHGGPASHGQKDRLRAPGSIGATGPARVMPGTKMAGRMGGDRTTLKKRIVEKIDKEKGIISIRGAVPGMRGSKVEIVS